jgi:hypothetical protein
MYESSIILLADTVSPQVPDTMDIEKKSRNHGDDVCVQLFGLTSFW